MGLVEKEISFWIVTLYQPVEVKSSCNQMLHNFGRTFGGILQRSYQYSIPQVGMVQTPRTRLHHESARTELSSRDEPTNRYHMLCYQWHVASSTVSGSFMFGRQSDPKSKTTAMPGRAGYLHMRQYHRICECRYPLEMKLTCLDSHPTLGDNQNPKLCLCRSTRHSTLRRSFTHRDYSPGSRRRRTRG